MLNELKKLVDENIIKEKVSMADVTTFKTGGIADVIVYPNNIDELKTIAESQGLTFLGAFADRSFDDVKNDTERIFMVVKKD